MPIISSQIISQQLQADQSSLIHEQHTDHKGIIHDVVYIMPEGLNSNAIMVERALNIGKEIDRREAESAEALNFAIGMSPFVFKFTRFTKEERIAIRDAAKTDPEVADILDMLESAENGVFTNYPGTVYAINTLRDKGWLTPERAIQVLS